MKHYKQLQSRRTPIYRDAGFVFDTIEQSQQAFDIEHSDPRHNDYVFYTRYANPNVMAAEQAVARLEGSEWAMLTASGMSAIDVALSMYHNGPETGTWLFFDEIYGGTKEYISAVLQPRRDIHVEYFKPPAGAERYDLAALEEALDRIQPTLLYFEPVSNPLLIVADGDRIVQMARERGIAVVVDNTFATPALWQPLNSGADLVVHSATKYLGGHGNITAGVVCGNDPDVHNAALVYRKLVGHILSPDDAYRLETQVKTFTLRFAAQCRHAARLAAFLDAHKAVKQVRYPGLASHPTHQESVKLFGERGFGAMVTFELAGGRAACEQFIADVADQVKYITTLGDADSILIYVPTVFGEDRFPYPGMLRFSVGFEPYEPLEACIRAALE